MDKERACRRFLILALGLVAAAFSLLAAFNFVIDPFNMNRLFDLGLEKELISGRANYRLYKMSQYRHNPIPDILLGDSRANALRADLIKDIAKKDCYNFAYGGGTIYEAIDTFWYAAGKCDLRSVYIGVNFNLYNKANHSILTGEARELLENPFAAYASPFMAKVSFYNVFYALFGWNLVSETPALDKEQFWERQLGLATEGFYRKYIYPDDAFAQLRQIGDYCAARGIGLTFIIPPTHVDLQEKIREYRLEAQYAKYKEDLRSIADTIDYDYDNGWTRNKGLFRDPYHFGDEIRRAMVEEIWTGKLEMGRRL
jgi:hypothetical protein